MSADDPRQKLLNLLDHLVLDLFSTSDEDIVAEALAGGLDPEAISAEVKSTMASACARAGKLRLAAARAQLNGVSALRSRPSITGLPAQKKDAILRRFAANDNPLQQRLTMAARNGDGLSEEEVDSVLLDLVELGAVDDQGNIL